MTEIIKASVTRHQRFGRPMVHCTSVKINTSLIMKKMYQTLLALLLLGLFLHCKPASDRDGSTQSAEVAYTGGQASIVDDESQKDVVRVAVGSPDHTTLVAAIQAAGLQHVLANPGPFTVFAPTNAAFEKLPPGTVENLLKPENLEQLSDILKHHVTTSVFEVANMRDGQIFSMADGNSARITKQNDDVMLKGAKILGSVRASNGIVHVVDAVILP